MRLLGSVVDFMLGQAVLLGMEVLARLQIAREAVIHRLVAFLLPGLEAELAHQLAFERAERARLEREIWLLKRRVGAPSGLPLCFCARLKAVFYSFRYPFPLRKMKELIRITGRTVRRYKALFRRGRSFLVPKTGRKRKPDTPVTLAHLIWQIHDDNPSWGRWRIALHIWRLGVFVSPSTVRNTLLRPRPHPLGPRQDNEKPKQAPRQFRGTTGTWAADFTRVKLWGLFHVWVLVVIDLVSRRALLLKVAGALYPTAEWVVGQFRNLLVELACPLHLLTDRGPVFGSDALKEFCRERGVNHRKTTPRRPQSNGRCEKFIGTLKQECLYRTFLVSTSQLQRLLNEYQEHFNTSRPHSALDGATPEEVFTKTKWARPPNHAKEVPEDIERFSVCGGLINCYRRTA